MKWILLVIATFLSGCTILPSQLEHDSLIDRGAYKVNVTHAAQGKNERIRFLVLHYTAFDDMQSLIALTKRDTSSHYLIPSNPAIHAGKPVALQLVEEHKRAWHAGLSDWNGRSNINDTSVGIEIVNLGYTDEAHDRRWYPYTAQQIDLIAKLSKDVIQRYGIAPENVVAHSDIAPLRKVDPGPLFPWQALAEQGIGAWPDTQTVQKYLGDRAPYALASINHIQTALARYGYTIDKTGALDVSTRKVISAFQMHFRPADISGQADAETEAIAMALVEKYKN